MLRKLTTWLCRTALVFVGVFVYMACVDATWIAFTGRPSPDGVFWLDVALLAIFALVVW
jgi:hypothetical protein